MADWKRCEKTGSTAILSAPPALINQALSLCRQATQFHLWEASSEDQAIGLIGSVKVGRKWSFVSVSSRECIQVLRDATEKLQWNAVLALLTNSKDIQIQEGCKCGNSSVTMAPVNSFVGRQTTEQFIQKLVRQQHVHKIGLVLQTEKEQDEDTFFGFQADQETPEFQHFYSRLGNLVKVSEHPKDLYNGDLPAGDFQFLYQRAGSHENAFHLVTRLPFKKNDEQHIERKKHVGNDSAVVVFRQFKSKHFEPTDFIVSHFIKVYLVFDLVDSVRSESGALQDIKVELKVFSRLVDPDYLLFKQAEGHMNDPAFLDSVYTLVVNAGLSAYSDEKQLRRQQDGFRSTIQLGIQQFEQELKK